MLNDNDRKGIAGALFESTKSTFGRVKIGALIQSKSGDAIGYGYNQRKTHPRQYRANKRVGKQTDNPCVHAEVDALNSLLDYGVFNDYADPHTIYVARLDRNGKWANCKPCAACESEIKLAGIKRVVYTTEHGIGEYVA